MRNDKVARAKQRYLLCKAAVERRRLEMEEYRKEGKDTSRLEQMLARLEASARANRKLMGQLSGDGK